METLSALVQRIGIESKEVDNNPNISGDAWDANHYCVTLRYDGRQMTTYFSMGIGLTDKPSAIEVVGCLVRDAHYSSYSFSEFCYDLGYDEDSRSAERTWKAIKKQTTRLRRLLGADYERFMAAENDD